MENVIIILVIAILVVLAIRPTMKHLKGKGGCCGGGTKVMQVPEKKLDKVIAQKTVVIQGMSCDHCKGWVEKAINEIDGASAKVNLKRGEAVVSLGKEVSDDVIRAAVKKAGYIVVEIQ